MKQALFAIICLLIFGTIIAMGQYFKQRDVDATFEQAQKRVDTFPDLPSVKPEVLIPQDLIDKELAKIEATERRANAEAAQAQAEAQAAQEKLAAEAKAEKDRIAAELEQQKKQAQLKASVPSLSGDDSGADAALEETDAFIEALNNTKKQATLTVDSANQTIDTMTDTVETVQETVRVADPVQMDEDGLPLKASDVEEVQVAMADTVNQAGETLDAVGETVTGLAAEQPTMAAQTIGPKAVILAYHQFIPGKDWSNSSHKTPLATLKQHLAALKENGYEVVPLSQLVAALKGEAQLPPKAAVITVDNGFNNALKVAAPEFKKDGLPWTFFVFTNLVSTGATGATWDELLVEVQDEKFDVQSQTKSHLFLTRKKGRDDKHYGEFLDKELKGSKSTIEQRLNQPVNALAFPFGNYNEEIVARAKKDGYEVMLTTEPGFVDFSQGPEALDALPRYVVTKESAPYLADFLSDHALEPTEITPRPGSVDGNARPEIKLSLTPSVRLKPDSVKATIDGVSETKATFDPSFNTITIVPQSDLNERAVRVTVTAQTESGEDTGLSWYYYFEPKLLPNE